MRYTSLVNTIFFANIVFLLFGIIGIDIFQTDSGYAQSSKDILSDPNLGQAKIVLTSHKYVENKDSNYGDIVGQVKNIGNGTAESVEVIFTYYDDNGEIVGTDSTYIDIQRLKPDQKAPFSQYVNKNTTQGMKNYEIALIWNNPDGSEEYIENAQITKEEKNHQQ